MPLPQPLDLDGKATAATGVAGGLGIDLSGAMKQTAEAKEIRAAKSSSPLRSRRA